MSTVDPPEVDHDARVWMQRAVMLAERAQGRVAPNPAVGAVLVRDGVVVGEGWTMPPGGPHAEVVALRQAGDAARGATLYVTLEPCAHFGRTPPCATAIVEAGVARVVVSAVDPFPEVNGRGIRTLIEHGVTVEVGTGAEEATRINAGFFKRVRTGLPEVTAKFAVSLDGRIATRTGHSKWITGPEARRAAHRLRDSHDAIVVGIGTVLADDPLLTTRLEPADTRDGTPHHPLRVVMDSRGRTPLSSAMLRADTPGTTLVAVTDGAPRAAIEGLRRVGADVAILPAHDGEVSPIALLRCLAERGVNRVLIEGGGRVHGAFFDAGLVDRVVAFIAPRVIGGVGAPVPVAGIGAETVDDAPPLEDVTVRTVGADVMIAGYVRRGEQREAACSAESSKRSALSPRSIAAEATTR